MADYGIILGQCCKCKGDVMGKARRWNEDEVDEALGKAQERVKGDTTEDMAGALVIFMENTPLDKQDLAFLAVIWAQLGILSNG